MTRVIWTVGISMLSLTAIGGMSGQTRDAAAPSVPTGTARIEGVVLAEHRPAERVPARRAIVTIAGAALPIGKSAVTDDTGRFVLDRIPAGRFTLTAIKPAYLPAEFGAMRPGRPGVPIVLPENGRMTDVTIVLTRGAALGGTIQDTAGAPVAGASITALRALPDGTLTSAGTATSDDRGRYRIFGLTAGSYLVGALPDASRGRGESVELDSDEIDRRLAVLRARLSTGRSTAPPGGPRDPVVTSSAVRVYHPRAFSTSDAVPVALAFGDDRSGVDIVLERARALTVEGAVSGAPESGAVTLALVAVGPGPQMPVSGPVLRIRPAGNGPYQFTNVTPGRYLVMARTTTGAQPMLWAQTAIEVAGADVRGVQLVMQPTLQLTGRLVFEATRLQPPANLSTITVILQDVRPAAGTGGGRGRASGRERDRRQTRAGISWSPAWCRGRIAS